MNDLRASLIGYLTATFGAGLLGLISDIFSAVLLGAAGAFGAWCINRWLNKRYPRK